MGKVRINHQGNPDENKIKLSVFFAFSKDRDANDTKDKSGQETGGREIKSHALNFSYFRERVQVKQPQLKRLVSWLLEAHSIASFPSS